MDQRQLLLKVCTCLGDSLLHFWLTKNIFSEAKCDIFLRFTNLPADTKFRRRSKLLSVEII